MTLSHLGKKVFGRRRVWARNARKVGIAVLGGAVLLIGLAMVVLPGPAFIVLPMGLAILATQFAWARRGAQKSEELLDRATGGRSTRMKARLQKALPALFKGKSHT